MITWMEICNNSIQICEKVYKPREDTIFLIDTIVGLPNFEELQKNGWIEVGSGTGAIICCLQRQGELCLAVDRNYHAAKLTGQNAKMNKKTVQTVAGDGLTPFRRKTLPANVVFNPPYLPEDPEADKGLSHEEKIALIGGKKGDEETWRVLHQMDTYQTAFVIISSLATTPNEMQARGRGKFKVETVGKLQLGLETLWVVQVKTLTEEWRGFHP